MKRKSRNKFISKLGITIVLLLITNFLLAQTGEKPKDNWQNLDLKTDSVFGISMEKTYTELLNGKKATSVIVAVIDGGVDVNHEDLKSVIWTNANEIPANGKDDDHNGFIDDIHGWNFYSTVVKEDEKAEVSATHNKLNILKTDQKILNQILQKINKSSPDLNDFKDYIPNSAGELKMQSTMVYGLKSYPDFLNYKKINLKRGIDYYNMQLSYYENHDFDPMTGGPSTYHGTHVTGIIAADRINNIGIKGVADHVKIMVLRTVSGLDPIRGGAEQTPGNQQNNNDIDEKTKAVAHAIRYAADNGAKIINMSFGQPWAKPSVAVSEAIKYAVSKDVLIVHASGNEGQNLDQMIIYPDRSTPEGQAIAACWIEVGASGWKNDEKLAGEFSNYGKNSIDVYAPGVEITSTAPRSTYLDDTGTSMAAPVVSGMAAVIREYCPKLSAAQVKNLIMKSVIEVGSLKDKCISGGIVNAYKAFKLVRFD
ncbi:subtilisin family serine protease [Pedobacter cryoconitis]|uniref:Subtilisin family serine protease n=1 Tax=Pedobacter cryoconitis TaxID=188932 RepID=A0A7W8YS27_9SPHI|nr:S8 family serine peptidase [Pedobacter cryoconitis]MBB5620642.1 subtilisin family serine protease [Pedobacter cryoconitis]